MMTSVTIDHLSKIERERLRAWVRAENNVRLDHTIAESMWASLTKREQEAYYSAYETTVSELVEAAELCLHQPLLAMLSKDYKYFPYIPTADLFSALAEAIQIFEEPDYACHDSRPDARVP
jgi:hypothetical protein